jgi:predicted dehydrogenase
MPARLGVGVVGASSTRGWALDAHLPALAGLPEYRLAAVATTRRETAERTARAFGAQAAYTDASALIDDPAVDIVIVCVKVPEHSPIVEHALRAGKHVYCEWPLALTTQEAAELAGLARRSGRQHAVGLQARSSPLLRTLRAELADGRLGRLLSCNVYSPTGSGGPTRDLARRYTADRVNGANTLTINTGHTLDTVSWLVGDLDWLDATIAVGQPDATVPESGEHLHVTAPDQVVVTGQTAGGCVVTVHAHSGARANGTHFTLRLLGTDGDLVVRSAGTRGLQIEELRAQYCPVGAADWQPVPVRPEAYAVGQPQRVQPVLNVAEALRQFAAGIRSGTSFEPDFAHAVALHHQLDAIELAHRTGVRQTARARRGEPPDRVGAPGAAA